MAHLVTFATQLLHVFEPLVLPSTFYGLVKVTERALKALRANVDLPVMVFQTVGNIRKQLVRDRIELTELELKEIRAKRRLSGLRRRCG